MSLTTNKTKLQTLINNIKAFPIPEYQEKTVTPATTSQTITPDDGYNGMTSVTVAAIPSKYEDRTESLPQLNTVNGGTAATTMAAAVDNTETLVEDEATLITQIQTALEETTYDPSGLQKKVIQPMVYDQIITADGAYQALSQVTVKGDANLKGENIVSGVSIFGVPGSYEGSGGNAPFVGEFASITDNGMYEPGVNEYVFDYSNCDVDLSAATCLLLGGSDSDDYNCCFCKRSSSTLWTVFPGSMFVLGSTDLNVNQTAKTITAYGSISSMYLTRLSFKAYFD